MKDKIRKFLEKYIPSIGKLKDKLQKFLEKYTPPIDKLKHFYWGSYFAFIGGLLYVVTGYLFFLWAVPMLIAITKELIDDEPSFLDFLYSVIPSIMLITIVLLAL